MFRLFIYLEIEFNNNKSLVRWIDQLEIKTMHVTTKISKLSTYILTLIFV